MFVCCLLFFNFSKVWNFGKVRAQKRHGIRLISLKRYRQTPIATNKEVHALKHEHSLIGAVATVKLAIFLRLQSTKQMLYQYFYILFFSIRFRFKSSVAKICFFCKLPNMGVNKMKIKRSLFCLLFNFSKVWNFGKVGVSTIVARIRKG